MDVGLESMRLWPERRRKKLDVLLTYARMRHVEKAMRPYLEASLLTVKNVSNLAASVQARLQNHARATKRPFQELLQYYAMERFLYRVSKSPHRGLFVLKGALMLHVWDAPLARAT